MTDKEKFREIVAALCHEQWSGWMIYMFNLSRFTSLGDTTIPMKFAERWKRQMTTAYENLPENEKRSNGIEADKFIRLFAGNSAITEIAALADVREALGVDEKPMLEELPAIVRQIKRDADRYAKVRKLTPQEFSGLWTKTLTSNTNFDELIDAWIEKTSISSDKKEI